MKRNYIYVLLSACMLSACGGGKCAPSSEPSPEPSPVQLDLELSPPAEYPAGVAVTMPIVITNQDGQILSGLNYSIVDNMTGTVLTITPDSLANCGTLAPNQNCTLNIQVPANSKPGSFTVVAKNSQAQISTVTGLALSVNGTGTGVNGITSYSPSVVTMNTNNSGVFLYTMQVNSANVGNFNSMVLVDGNGNKIPYQVVTGNSGDGLTALTQGSVVTLAVKIPAGATQVSFYPVLEQNGTPITNGTSSTPTIVTVLRPTSTPQAVLDIYPSNFNLSESNQTQTVTVINNGNGNASAMTPAVNAPVSIDSAHSTCGATLAVGASCTYTLKFDANTDKAGIGSLGLNYNNGQSSTTTTSNNTTYTYKGIAAVANLTPQSPSNPSFNFTTSTGNGSESSIVTLTNNGVTPIGSINATLPSGFTSFTNNVPNACTPNLVLQPGQSCNVGLNYTNTTIQGKTTEPVVFNYTYSDPVTQIPTSGSSTVNMTVQTLQSEATLSLNSDTVHFTTVANNGIESSFSTIVITNIGLSPTASTPSISLADGSTNYSIAQNNCTSLLNVGESCTVIVKSGPFSSSTAAGTVTGALNVNYLPYPGATTNLLSTVGLSTQVATAQSAIINVVQSSTTGFSGSNTGESSEAPLMLSTNATGTVTYTINNTGDVPATNFSLGCGANGNSSCTGVLAPWTTTNTCTTIPAHGSCTVTYALSTPATGANNLPASNVTMNWVDQDSTTGQSQSFATTPLYTSVYPALTLTTSTTPSPIGTLIQRMQLQVLITLSGGYQVTPQTVTSTIGNDTNNDMTSSSSSCQVSAESSTCILTYTVKANPTNESNVTVTMVNTTTPAVVPTPSSYTFNVAYNAQPFSVDPVSPKVGESFNFTPTFTADEPSATNPYTVTLPSGITTDSGASSYTMTSNPYTRHLNVAPGTPPGLYPITMTDSYGNTFTISIPVAVLQSMMYLSDGTGVYSCKFDQLTGVIIGNCGLDSLVTDNTSVVGLNSTGTYAYIGGRFSANPNTKIKICAVSSSNGSYGKFTSCSYYNGLSFSSYNAGSLLVSGAVVNTQQTKLYVTATNSNILNVCNITPTNAIPTSCSTVTIGGATGLARATFNYNSNQLIIADDSGYLFTCAIQNDGSVGACSQSAQVVASPNQPIGVGFNYDNSKVFSVGYVPSGVNPFVKYATYSVSTNSIGSTFNNGIANNISGLYPYLTEIAFSKTYAYISAIGSPTGYGLLSCSLTSNGILNQCTPVSTSVFSGNLTDGVTIFN